MSRKMGGKLETLDEKIGSLAERMSAVEGQLKQIPSWWTIMAGQVAAAVGIGGILLLTFSAGIGASRQPPPSPAVSSPFK